MVVGRDRDAHAFSWAKRLAEAELVSQAGYCRSAENMSQGMFVLRALKSPDVSRLINGGFTIGCGKWCAVVSRSFKSSAVSDGVKRMKEEGGRRRECLR